MKHTSRSVTAQFLGESDDLQVKGDRNTPGHEKYRNHLEIGYQRYAKTFEELFTGGKTKGNADNVKRLKEINKPDFWQPEWED